MPYEIRKVKGGYKVGHKGQGKTYSKKPLSKRKAKKQLRALYANANPKLEKESRPREYVNPSSGTNAMDLRGPS